MTVTAALGSLSNVAIAPVNVTGVLEYATNYTVKFTIANALSIATTPSIVVKFDSSTLGWKVGARTCSIIVLNTGYTCTADASTN